MIKETDNSDRGVDYKGVQTNQSFDGTMTNGSDKFTLNGKISLEIMQNSWKFGKQIQIVVFGKSVTKGTRANNNGWERIEIAMPFEVGKSLFEQFHNNVLSQEENDNANK